MSYIYYKTNVPRGEIGRHGLKILALWGYQFESAIEAPKDIL